MCLAIEINKWNAFGKFQHFLILAATLGKTFGIEALEFDGIRTTSLGGLD
jgi:hypothetical protein